MPDERIVVRNMMHRRWAPLIMLGVIGIALILPDPEGRWIWLSLIPS